MTQSRCRYCFRVTNGGEFCTQICADAAREEEEAVVVYPEERQWPSSG